MRAFQLVFAWHDDQIASPIAPHLGMHVLQGQAQLHEDEHDVILVQQLPLSRPDEGLQVSTLDGVGAGRGLGVVRPHARAALQNHAANNTAGLSLGSTSPYLPRSIP